MVTNTNATPDRFEIMVAYQLKSLTNDVEHIRAILDNRVIELSEKFKDPKFDVLKEHIAKLEEESYRLLNEYEEQFKGQI